MDRAGIYSRVPKNNARGTYCSILNENKTLRDVKQVVRNKISVNYLVSEE